MGRGRRRCAERVQEKVKRRGSELKDVLRLEGPLAATPLPNQPTDFLNPPFLILFFYWFPLLSVKSVQLVTEQTRDRITFTNHIFPHFFSPLWDISPSLFDRHVSSCSGERERVLRLNLSLPLLFHFISKGHANKNETRDYFTRHKPCEVIRGSAPFFFFIIIIIHCVLPFAAFDALCVCREKVVCDLFSRSRRLRQSIFNQTWV